MKDLRDLWTMEGILIDANNDGVPDGADFDIVGINEKCRPIGIIDFFVRMGLETTALSFPLTGNKNSGSLVISLEIDPTKTVSICKLNDEKTAVTFVGPSESQVSELLRWIASYWPYSLPNCLEASQEEVMEIGFNDRQYYVMFSNGKKSEWQTHEQNEEKTIKKELKRLSGLHDLWTTSGFFQGGRVDLNSQLDVAIQINGDKVSADMLVKSAELAARTGLHSTGVHFPITAEGHLQREPEICFVIDITNDPNCHVSIEWNNDTNYIVFKGQEKAIGQALTYFTNAKPTAEGGTFGIWEEIFLKCEKQPEPKLLQKEWEDAGEKTQLEVTLSKWIKEEDVTDDQLSIICFVSEPVNIRKQLTEKYSTLLSEKSTETNVIIRSAYKPGYFWVEEEVIPLIDTHQKRIGKIVISCQEEQGGGLELSNRWIQEMYPVDLLLAKTFNISSDDIVFEITPSQESTFVVTAYDETNHPFVTTDLTVPVSEIDYIDNKQKVYPTSGTMAFYRNSRLEKELANPTDRERFWKFFTSELMPELTTLLPLEEDGRGVKIPFFSRLLVEVEMSEEERKLGFDEERISSLEALHEDIYFDVLDYFEYLGEERVGKGWNAPGGVHPFMHVKAGASPKAKITLYGLNIQSERKVITESLTFDSTSHEPTSCTVRLISKEKEEKHTVSQEKWQLKETIDWPTELKELDRIPGVAIWLGGVSYEGRSIPVVELTKPSSSTHYSTHKLSLYKPTIFIEAGHHANEVSSMPAIRELVMEIATNQSNLLNKMNIVVVPSANPDGVALHQQMAKDNPEWKHHAARYNAVGLEYAQVRFEETIFGEADVVPKAIHRWLPDIVIDDHGIPSHEWVQPFAGFNSPPRFPVSYWIPNSLIYGIARQLPAKEYPEHAETLNKIIENITKTVNEDIIVKEKNQYWKKRFKKYGTNWLPAVFPVEETDGMIFYRWNKAVDSYSKAYIYRHPEWCTADLITEAADETVYDEALANCVKAHQLFNLGVIHLIASKDYKVNSTFDNGYIKYVRKRPLNL